MSLSDTISKAALRVVLATERVVAGQGVGTPLNEIRNFLLLQHSTALGSIVHATPLVAALRAAVPDCRIVVAASGMAVEVFRNHPDLHAVIETPNPFRDLVGAGAALRRSNPLRGQAFATITTTGNERTRVALQAILAVARNRVGFAVLPGLYSSALQYDKSISQIANNLRIVGALGHKLPERAYEPQVYFTDGDRQFAQRTLATAGVEAGQPVAVFVTQTSVTQRKSWRRERFQAAAEFLRRQYGAHIVFVGTAAESAAIDAIRDGLSFATTSVAGRTSLTQLSALLSLCDVGLTLDTGTMHLGRAVGLPMVIIAPAWSPPVEWLPLGDPRFRILKNLDMPFAPEGYVIDEVSVDEVTACLADLMLRYPKPR